MKNNINKIDSKLLLSEIERRYHKAVDESKYMNSAKFVRNELENLREFAYSLQQEQQKPNLENEIKDYTETLYHETFGNGQGTLDEFDWEDIVQVIDETARYFYNLNKSDV